jgi:hypothetical protein
MKKVKIFKTQISAGCTEETTTFPHSFATKSLQILTVIPPSTAYDDMLVLPKDITEVYLINNIKTLHQWYTNSSKVIETIVGALL